MKTLLSKFLMLSGIIMLALASCKKDGDLATVSSTSTTAGVLTASTTTPVLTKATLTATSVTFTTTSPNYGFSAAHTDSLEFDVHSDAFAKVKKAIAVTTGTTVTYSVLDFNNILLGMSLPVGISAQVDVRLKSSLSATVGKAYSNIVTLTVTPFALASYVYVPGAYQGWNPATADSLLSATSNGIYTGIINFPLGKWDFLITPAKNWNNKYATANGPDTIGRKTTSNYPVTYNGANNFFASEIPGQYQVTLNTNTNTLTVVPVQYYYSIIGNSAVDWNTDVDMKFNNGLQLWTLTTALNATAGNGFKVRRNHDWGTSYGWPTSAPSTTVTSASGNNMSVTVAGTYYMTFVVSATDATQGTFTATKQ